jgi:N-acetylmuramoyl-L-alanine amidase
LRARGSPFKLPLLKGFGRSTLSISTRRLVVAALLAAPAVVQAAPSPLTVVTPTARREVPTVVRDGVELVAIEDVAVGFGMTVRSDFRQGSAVLVVASHEVVLYEGKSLASVDGDLRLLSAPARNEDNRWLVPVDGVPRLLGPLLDVPVEWRAAQRVLVVGRVSIPSVSVATFTSADLVRVVFDASEAVPFHVEQGSDRVTVSVGRDLVDASLKGEAVSGGIVEWVQFRGGPENTFVVKLGPRFRRVRAREQESPPRLVLELRGEPASAAGEEPAPAPPPPQPARARPPESVRTIVIDPGHGGDEVGARGPGGTLEKDVVLAIARRLRDQLVNKLGVQVFLTRDSDVEMDLDTRTAIANNYKADLFVSIHANAVRARGAKGSEVYFLSYQASDEASRHVAMLEGIAEPLGSADPGSALELILWDMAQAEHLEESSALATRIQDELGGVTGSQVRGVKQAPFRVLVGATMPAVLVEVAFISNPHEEKLLASPAYQTKVAGALLRGIARYRRERAARLGWANAPAGRP